MRLPGAARSPDSATVGLVPPALTVAAHHPSRHVWL
jgi:hypothetical protein